MAIKDPVFYRYYFLAPVLFKEGMFSSIDKVHDDEVDNDNSNIEDNCAPKVQSYSWIVYDVRESVF